MTQQQVEVPSTVVLPPQTALQLGGQSLSQITTALGAQPLMLTVVLLNMVFAAVGGYFLLQLEKYRAANLTALIQLVQACVLETTPLASEENKKARELETLIEQNKQEMQQNKEEIDRLRQGEPK
jgi:uncharacterized protein HemX